MKDIRHNAEEIRDLIHGIDFLSFGVGLFDKDKFVPITSDKVSLNKPRSGGFWACPVWTDDPEVPPQERGYAWIDFLFTEISGSHKPEIDSGGCRFKLSPDARVLVIDSREDLPRKYIHYKEESIAKNVVDFIAISQDYDAFLLTENGVADLRNRTHDDEVELPDWDMESLLIFNPEAVTDVRPLAEADNAVVKDYLLSTYRTLSGEQSLLSVDDYDYVHSPEFKRFFGDWENDPEHASVILNERGEPLPLYHGSNRLFDRFDFSKLGLNTGKTTWTPKDSGVTIEGDTCRAMFFSSSLTQAVSYSLLAQYDVFREKHSALSDLWPVFDHGTNMFIRDRKQFVSLMETVADDVPELLPIIQEMKGEPGKSFLRDILPAMDAERRKTITDAISEKRDALKESVSAMDRGGLSNSYSSTIRQQKVIRTLEENVFPLMRNDLSVPNEFGTFEQYDCGIIGGSGNVEIWITTDENKRIRFQEKGKPAVYFDETNFDWIYNYFIPRIRTCNKELLEKVNGEIDRLGYNVNAHIYKCFLKSSRPLEKDYEGSSYMDIYKGDENTPTAYIAALQVQEALDKGNDAVVYRNITDPFTSDSYGVFDEDQIMIAGRMDKIVLGEDNFKMIDIMDNQNQKDNNLLQRIAEFRSAEELGFYSHEETLNLEIDLLASVGLVHTFILEQNIKDGTRSMEKVMEELDKLQQSGVLSDEDRAGFLKRIDSLNGPAKEAAVTAVKPIVVERMSGAWTRAEAQSHPETLYVFTDNTDRDSGHGVIDRNSRYYKRYGDGINDLHFPTQTAAVIRGLENAFPVSTQRWYHQGAKGESGRWTDKDASAFSLTVQAEIDHILAEVAFNPNISKVMLPGGDGFFNSKISAITKERTPELYRIMESMEKYLENGIKRINEMREANPVFFSLSEQDKLFLITGLDEENRRGYFKAEEYKNFEYLKIVSEENSLDEIIKNNPKLFSRKQEQKQEEAPIQEFQKEYRFLSNFWSCPVMFEGVIYPSAENAYQAAKCDNREDRAQFLNISAADAKRLGKSIVLRSNWEVVREEIMLEIEKDKYTRNPDLAQKLMDTAPQRLVEGNNWHDTYWGVDLGTGEGENKLGRILEDVRRDLIERKMTNNMETEQKNLIFTESAGGYQQRTKENAQSQDIDITIAIAADMSTFGERATAKAAGSRYIGIETKDFSLANAKKVAGEIYEKLSPDFQNGKPLGVNFAGNGAYTLVKFGVSQEMADVFVSAIVAELMGRGVQFRRILSGGQTGLDEAGITAALVHGIPAVCHAPKGFLMRITDGDHYQDVMGRERFENRFKEKNLNAIKTMATTPQTDNAVIEQVSTRIATGQRMLSEGRISEKDYLNTVEKILAREIRKGTMTEAVADAIRNRYPVTPPVAKAPEAQPVDVMDPNQLGELFEQMNGRQEESPQEQQPSFNYEEQMAVQPDNAREIEIIQSLSENQLKALMYFGMPWKQISPDAESLWAPVKTLNGHEKEAIEAVRKMQPDEQYAADLSAVRRALLIIKNEPEMQPKDSSHRDLAPYWFIYNGADDLLESTCRFNLNDKGMVVFMDEPDITEVYPDNSVAMYLTDKPKLVPPIFHERVSDWFYGLNEFRKQAGLDPIPYDLSSVELNKISDYTMFSEGLNGAQSEWMKLAAVRGVHSVNYFTAQTTPNGNRRLSDDEYNEGVEKVNLANATLGRRPEKYYEFFAPKWQSVKEADAVFCISSFDQNRPEILTGGEAWSVQMAIDAGKPVYVYDQDRSHAWHSFNQETKQWERLDRTPVLTTRFAAVGAAKLNAFGQAAIEGVYNNTFGFIISEEEVEEGRRLEKDTLKWFHHLNPSMKYYVLTHTDYHNDESSQLIAKGLEGFDTATGVLVDFETGEEDSSHTKLAQRSAYLDSLFDALPEQARYTVFTQSQAAVSQSQQSVDEVAVKENFDAVSFEKDAKTDVMYVPAGKTREAVEKYEPAIHILHSADLSTIDFSNPFVNYKDPVRGHLVFTMKQSTEAYDEWLRGTSYSEVEPERRALIVQAILSGELYGCTVMSPNIESPDMSYKTSQMGWDAAQDAAYVLLKYINDPGLLAKSINLAVDARRHSRYEDQGVGGSVLHDHSSEVVYVKNDNISLSEDQLRQWFDGLKLDVKKYYLLDLDMTKYEDSRDIIAGLLAERWYTGLTEEEKHDYIINKVASAQHKEYVNALDGLLMKPWFDGLKPEDREKYINEHIPSSFGSIQRRDLAEALRLRESIGFTDKSRLAYVNSVLASGTSLFPGLDEAIKALDVVLSPSFIDDAESSGKKSEFLDEHLPKDLGEPLRRKIVSLFKERWDAQKFLNEGEGKLAEAESRFVEAKVAFEEVSQTLDEMNEKLEEELRNYSEEDPVIKELQESISAYTDENSGEYAIVSERYRKALGEKESLERRLVKAPELINNFDGIVKDNRDAFMSAYVQQYADAVIRDFYVKNEPLPLSAGEIRALMSGWFDNKAERPANSYLSAVFSVLPPEVKKYIYAESKKGLDFDLFPNREAVNWFNDLPVTKKQELAADIQKASDEMRNTARSARNGMNVWQYLDNLDGGISVAKNSSMYEKAARANSSRIAAAYNDAFAILGAKEQKRLYDIYANLNGQFEQIIADASGNKARGILEYALTRFVPEDVPENDRKAVEESFAAVAAALKQWGDDGASVDKVREVFVSLDSTAKKMIVEPQIGVSRADAWFRSLSGTEMLEIFNEIGFPCKGENPVLDECYDAVSAFENEMALEINASPAEMREHCLKFWSGLSIDGRVYIHSTGRDIATTPQSLMDTSHYQVYTLGTSTKSIKDKVEILRSIPRDVDIIIDTRSRISKSGKLVDGGEMSSLTSAELKDLCEERNVQYVASPILGLMQKEALAPITEPDGTPKKDKWGNPQFEYGEKYTVDGRSEKCIDLEKKAQNTEGYKKEFDQVVAMAKAGKKVLIIGGGGAPTKSRLCLYTAQELAKSGVSVGNIFSAGKGYINIEPQQTTANKVLNGKRVIQGDINDIVFRTDGSFIAPEGMVIVGRKGSEEDLMDLSRPNFGKSVKIIGEPVDYKNVCKDNISRADLTLSFVFNGLSSRNYQNIINDVKTVTGKDTNILVPISVSEPEKLLDPNFATKKAKEVFFGVEKGQYKTKMTLNRYFMSRFGDDTFDSGHLKINIADLDISLIANKRMSDTAKVTEDELTRTSLSMQEYLDNGLHTVDVETGITQEHLHTFMVNFFKALINSGWNQEENEFTEGETATPLLGIDKFYSTGGSGIPEAVATAAQQLGIDVEMHTVSQPGGKKNFPLNYDDGTFLGKTVYNSEAFFTNRFYQGMAEKPTLEQRRAEMMEKEMAAYEKNISNSIENAKKGLNNREILALQMLSFDNTAIIDIVSLSQTYNQEEIEKNPGIDVHSSDFLVGLIERYNNGLNLTRQDIDNALKNADALIRKAHGDGFGLLTVNDDRYPKMLLGYKETTAEENVPIWKNVNVTDNREAIKNVRVEIDRLEKALEKTNDALVKIPAIMEKIEGYNETIASLENERDKVRTSMFGGENDPVKQIKKYNDQLTEMEKEKADLKAFLENPEPGTDDATLAEKRTALRSVTSKISVLERRIDNLEDGTVATKHGASNIKKLKELTERIEGLKEARWTERQTLLALPYETHEEAELAKENIETHLRSMYAKMDYLRQSGSDEQKTKKRPRIKSYRDSDGHLYIIEPNSVVGSSDNYTLEEGDEVQVNKEEGVVADDGRYKKVVRDVMPALIWFKGDLDVLNKPTVGLIGTSRQTSNDEASVVSAKEIAAKCSENRMTLITTITGTAKRGAVDILNGSETASVIVSADTADCSRNETIQQGVEANGGLLLFEHLYGDKLGNEEARQKAERIMASIAPTAVINDTFESLRTEEKELAGYVQGNVFMRSYEDQVNPVEIIRTMRDQANALRLKYNSLNQLIFRTNDLSAIMSGRLDLLQDQIEQYHPVPGKESLVEDYAAREAAVAVTMDEAKSLRGVLENDLEFLKSLSDDRELHSLLGQLEGTGIVQSNVVDMDTHDILAALEEKGADLQQSIDTMSLDKDYIEALDKQESFRKELVSLKKKAGAIDGKMNDILKKYNNKKQAIPEGDDKTAFDNLNTDKILVEDEIKTLRSEYEPFGQVIYSIQKSVEDARRTITAIQGVVEMVQYIEFTNQKIAEQQGSLDALLDEAFNSREDGMKYINAQNEIKLIRSRLEENDIHVAKAQKEMQEAEAELASVRNRLMEMPSVKDAVKKEKEMSVKLSDDIHSKNKAIYEEFKKRDALKENLASNGLTNDEREQIKKEMSGIDETIKSLREERNDLTKKRVKVENDLKRIENSLIVHNAVLNGYKDAEQLGYGLFSTKGSSFNAVVADARSHSIEAVEEDRLKEADKIARGMVKSEQDNIQKYPISVKRYDGRQIFLVPEEYTGVRDAIKAAYGEDSVIMDPRDSKIVEQRIKTELDEISGLSVDMQRNYTGVEIQRPVAYTETLYFYDNHLYSVQNAPSAFFPELPDNSVRYEQRERFDKIRAAAIELQKSLQASIGYTGDNLLHFPTAIHVEDGVNSVKIMAGTEQIAKIYINNQGVIKVSSSTTMASGIGEHFVSEVDKFQRFSAYTDKHRLIADNDVKDIIETMKQVLFSVDMDYRLSPEYQNMLPEERDEVDNRVKNGFEPEVIEGNMTRIKNDIFTSDAIVLGQLMEEDVDRAEFFAQIENKMNDVRGEIKNLTVLLKKYEAEQNDVEVLTNEFRPDEDVDGTMQKALEERGDDAKHLVDSTRNRLSALASELVELKQTAEQIAVADTFGIADVFIEGERRGDATRSEISRTLKNILGAIHGDQNELDAHYASVLSKCDGLDFLIDKNKGSFDAETVKDIEDVARTFREEAVEMDRVSGTLMEVERLMSGATESFKEVQGRAGQIMEEAHNTAADKQKESAQLLKESGYRSAQKAFDEAEKKLQKMTDDLEALRKEYGDEHELVVNAKNELEGYTKETTGGYSIAKAELEKALEKKQLADSLEEEGKTILNVAKEKSERILENAFQRMKDKLSEVIGTLVSVEKSLAGTYSKHDDFVKAFVAKAEGMAGTKDAAYYAIVSKSATDAIPHADEVAKKKEGFVEKLKESGRDIKEGTIVNHNKVVVSVDGRSVVFERKNFSESRLDTARKNMEELRSSIIEGRREIEEKIAKIERSDPYKKHNQEILKKKFTVVGAPSHGVAIVTVQGTGKQAYADAKTLDVFSGFYDKCKPFGTKFGKVDNADGTINLVMRDGKEVFVEPVNELTICPCDATVAFAKQKDMEALLDMNKVQIIGNQWFKHIYAFQDGLAVVRTAGEEGKPDAKYNVVRKDGRKLSVTDFDDIGQFNDKGNIAVRKGTRHYNMDKEGKLTPVASKNVKFVKPQTVRRK